MTEENKTEETEVKTPEETPLPEAVPSAPAKTYSDAQMLYDRIQAVEAELLALKGELTPQAITGLVLQGIEKTMNPVLSSIDTRIRHLESGGIREDLVDAIANRLALKLKGEDDADEG
jgi:hypothetical protein